MSVAATARKLYGLGVGCNVPVAALQDLPAAPRSDVQWHVGRIPDELEAADWRDYRRVEASAVSAARTDDGSHYRLRYDDGTVCVLDSAGRHVWADAPAPFTTEDIATYLLGPVMGFVLRLRGVTCLHASAVDLGGRAIAFAGHAGSGKSSTAAAFARAGHRVITDDVTAIAEVDGVPHVEAAYPRVRLWPESVGPLFGSPEALPRITAGWDKRFLALDGRRYRFQARRQPLAAICILGDRSAGSTRIEPLPGGEALIWLVAHAYSAHLLEPGMRAREFECLARLVERVPVVRLETEDGLGRLPSVCAGLAERFADASV